MRTQVNKGLLPDYVNPPVVETILGVQFDRLPDFKNAHLGAFWKTLDTIEWPTVADALPLEPQFERFGESGRWARAALQLRLAQDLPSRVQIKNKDGDRLIQVQNGRLHFNWLGKCGGNYPRYDSLRQSFIWALERFTEFVAEEKFGEFQPNQWEVTYLNHIPQQSVWNAPSDWGFFLPLAGLPTIEGVIQGESFGGEWHFVIPDKRGRLHVNWQHGAESESEGKEVVVLNLTARGGLEFSQSDKVQAIINGLDLGRETIVRSFSSTV